MCRKVMFNKITGIDINENNPDLYTKYNPGVADTDLGTLDLVTTEQPTSGGRDLIYGDQGQDFVFGGTDADTKDDQAGGGTLICISQFTSGSKAVVNTDVLKITVSLTGSDA